MNDFKVGDWVRNNNNEIFQLDDLHMWQKKDLNSLVKLWQPKEGEWCWFYNRHTEVPLLRRFEYIFNGRFYTNDEIMFDICEPFIGELPSFIKDKQ